MNQVKQTVTLLTMFIIAIGTILWWGVFIPLKTQSDNIAVTSQATEGIVQTDNIISQEINILKIESPSDNVYVIYCTYSQVNTSLALFAQKYPNKEIINIETMNYHKGATCGVIIITNDSS